MIKELLAKRALSWSAIASFEWSKEDWYKKYVLKIKQPSNPAMEFGKVVGERLATDTTFLPEVLRYPVFEKELRGVIGDIPLVGFLDSYDPATHHFYEYKTSANTKKWNQKSAEAHGQILFYMFLIWVNYKIPPEKLSATLFYIPVEESGSFELKLSEAPVQSFKVKHTSVEVLNFGIYVKNVVKEMGEYVKANNPERDVEPKGRNIKR